RATDDALVAAMVRRFPETTGDEVTTYRKYVLPAFKKAIAEAQARWGSLRPWSFGGPGFSHAAAILRDALADDNTRLRRAALPPGFRQGPHPFGGDPEARAPHRRDLPCRPRGRRPPPLHRPPHRVPPGLRPRRRPFHRRGPPPRQGGRLPPDPLAPALPG